MISATNVGYIIHIDLSNLGWGAHDEDPNIKGRWCDSEKTLHINYLELLAIKLAIKSFLSRKDLMRHLIIMCDNSTKVANINKQGGTQSTTCNQLAEDILDNMHGKWTPCICSPCTWQAEYISRNCI